MKKILVVAALLATAAMPVSGVSAASAAMAAPVKPAAVCFFLPLLPDCISAWKAESDAMMTKMAAPAPKKMAMAAPMMLKMPNCTKAAAGAGHMYDCKM
jgi:hypothetical protein